MPYSNARYYVVIVIGVIILGFWPSYFSVVTNVPWQFHAHGVAASLWVAMVAVQSWTAHSKKQLMLHRAIGRTSLFLFPFLIAGLCAIIDVTGKGYVAGDGPVRMMDGAGFMIGLAIAIAAYVTVYFRALKFRRKVWVHSGYMLSTPIILFESPFSRVVNAYVPGFVVNGPADFHLIMPSILGSMALELVFIAAIWLNYRDKAWPFVVAGGFIAAQIVTMGLMTDSAVLKAILVAIGHTPSAVIVMTGFAVGALTSWAGWQAGKRAAGPVAAAQPA
jgi:hypothetical protein